uniref:SecY-independent transporter protein n=1 Tax=Gelidiella acerosa TaxID=28867 RepID=A0A7G9IVQ5_9FLOR|nr:SecY-independent transporter protein [Gelidiella acerosa]QNM39449.1 SecY-independent transporter protein [Gelidiella acerosa]
MRKGLSFYIYINELFYRILYLLFNGITILLILLYKYDTLFFIKIFPVLVAKKRFISTGIAELIELWWVLLLSSTILISWPFFTLQLGYFLKTGLYRFQFYVLNTFNKKAFVNYYIFLIIYYFLIFPFILQILFSWGARDINFNPFKFLEIQPNILEFINLISNLQYLTGYVVLINLFYLLNLSLLKNPHHLFTMIEKYKQSILFLFILFLFILFPSDFLLNFFTPFLNFILLESLHLFSCFNLINKIK